MSKYGYIQGPNLGLIVLNLVLLATLYLMSIRDNNSNSIGFNIIADNYNPIDQGNTIADVKNVDPFEVHKERPIDIQNASAIFNTIQSALKEKDSNVQPNGVSFIPAYVPPNTRFYHSTPETKIPSSFEWIAMDYEFSYLFAGSGRKRKWNHKRDSIEPAQSPLKNEQSIAMIPGPPDAQAYLYTFRTTKPLTKLILLDGASAAKSSPKMDQQMILSRQTNTTQRVNERVSSEKICNWGKQFGLQGIIRLEVGFEIIVCDFHKDLELIGNVTLSSPYELLNFPETTGDNNRASSDLTEKREHLLDKLDAVQNYDWVKAGSMSDTGENRILLDFSGMVTPLNKTYVDPNPFKRNISYISNDLKEGIISDLETYLASPVIPFEKTDWQAITSNIVFKFSPILSMLNGTMNNYCNSDTATTNGDLKGLGDDLMTITYAFVRRHSDKAISNWEMKKDDAFNASISDYVFHTYPLQGTDYLIYSSIFKVQYEITQLLFDCFELSKSLVDIHYLTTETPQYPQELSDRAMALKTHLNNLLETLNWADFYRCSKKCNIDEICYAPTWGPSPFAWGPGTNDDFFVPNDGYFSIERELRCINYRDVMAYQKSH